jgi:S1-C subfamily serine protease
MTLASWARRAVKILFFFVLILVIGGIGGVLFDRSLLPALSASHWFSESGWLQKLSERTTIINKTEQVVVREDDSVEKIISQPATAVVNIVSVGAPASTESGASEAESIDTALTRTGVLLTNDGLIVTYQKTPPETEGVSFTVLLFDGKSYKASYVGFDRLSNLAYFRLDEKVNVPAIALANSDDARIGKKLIALGNSFAEYQNRVAVGVLGNINRTFNLAGKTVSSSEKWEGVFETDLQASSDFIGGPVIGYNGEMVGLVGSLLLDNTETTFIIPANVVRSSLSRALQGTLEKRATLGIYYLPITKAYALGHGLSRDRGALIYAPGGRTGLAVLSDSPAARAGLRAGDIVTAVAGTEVNLDKPLPELLSDRSAGDTVEFTILRNGQEEKLQITL